MTVLVTLMLYNFKEYFRGELAQQLGVSPRKAIAHIHAFGVSQISGLQVNGGKQVMYLRNEEMGLFITEALG